MSQYPYPYGYGQYHGPPPQTSQPAQPYNYHRPAYPAPPFNQAYDPGIADGNLTAPQNSFNYNSNLIPGLGIGGLPSPHPGYNTVPDAGAWPQPPPFPSAPPGLPQPAQTPSGVSSFNGQVYSAGPWAPSPAHHATSPLPVPQTKPTANNDVEEGELSEGQFEDLYEPRNANEPAGALPNAPKPSSAPDPAQPGSVVDTPEAGFYGNDEEEGEVVVTNRQETARARERSGSYSPFLSPRELQTENTTPQATADSEEGPSSPFLAPSQAAKLKAASQPQPELPQQKSDQTGTAVPGLQHASEQTSRASESNTREAGAPDLQTSGPLCSFVSLQEAKKEAQKAILRLWPLGVKYQHYIDEGFDEQVIKALFGELHLDMPKRTTEPSRVPGQGTQLGNDAASPSTTQQSASGSKDSSSKSDGQSKGEERKDRIARLLAAKAAKAPTSSTTSSAPDQPKIASSQTQMQESNESCIQTQKTKQWGEKELLLQKKIAALQKSREAQAQRSATDGGNGLTTSAATGKIQASLNNPDAIPITPQPGTQLSDQPREGSAQAGSLQGLPTHSPAQHTSSTGHRKRPVAADFVDYSSTVGPLKRPFGHNRKETSIIIDVSDGSDDEEMDMDMESPIEDPSTSRIGTFAQRGPAIRDFPPLTNTPPPRQFSSPIPVSRTPPNGLANGKRKETELDLKEKAIQDMRRKIAEAEARRKAKNSSVGSQTPNQTDRTPESKENEASGPLSNPQLPQPNPSGAPLVECISEALSASLPRHSERRLSQQPQTIERRGRIVSLELPRIKESLDEMIKRLNQIREEELRLQSEIDQQLAQEKLLTQELEQIDTNPSDSQSEQDGLDSSSNSGPASQVDTIPPDQQVMSTSQVLSGASDPSSEAGDVSMDEDQSSRESSHDPISSREPSQPSQKDLVPAGMGERGSRGNSHEHGSASPRASASLNERTARDSDNPPSIQQQPQAFHGDVPDAYSGAEADSLKLDEMTPMEMESTPLSPVLDHPTSHLAVEEDTSDNEQPSAASANRAFSAAESRADTREADVGPAGEVANEIAPEPERGFVPYQSPLRYFLAYRYHPDFRSCVPGGLKSLTYSNRIDPKTTFCPYELNGQVCPEGCEFQHFKSITIGDDQILVELGRSDDYAGEQKNRFIQGLRELLQDFRANKVKDFDTIARGIIEYRSRFLEDKSKILNLEGVTL